MRKITTAMRKKDNKLKKTALDSIQKILVSQYKVPNSLAPILIKRSKIDQIFDRNAEIAAHTSNKTWAQRAHEQLNKNDYVLRSEPHKVSKMSKPARRRKINA